MNDTVTSQNISTITSSFSAGRMYKLVLNIYVVGLLCVFGIAGNLVSLVVLGRDRSIRRTTGLLLRALAVADTAYLVSCLFIQTGKEIYESTDWASPGLRRIWPYIEPYMWPFASIAQTGNVWILVAVTADRYVAICRPLHAAQYSTVSRSRLAATLCTVLAVIYNLPRFFERATDVTSPSVGGTTNTTELAVSVIRTSLRENHIYIIVYKCALFFVARFLVPFSTIAFFNTRLIMAIRASARLQASDRRSLRDMKRRERYTLTLVVVVLVFVVCELPDLFLRTWMALHELIPDFPFPKTELRHVNTVSNLFLTINSSVNFIIYCVVGRRFRDVLSRVVCSGEPTPLRRYPPLPADQRAFTANGGLRSTDMALRSHLERSGAETSQFTVRVV